MTDELADFLLAPAGRVLIAEAEALLAAGAETLAALTRLRKAVTPDQAAAAWEQANLRRRAVLKFGAESSSMYFVREALEQASSARAASYHAARFVEAGVTDVADLCGGIGGDALAFARAGLSVTLYERDPARARFATENARACGLDGRIRVRLADVTREEIIADAAWFDPARREGGRRVASADDYLPPLNFAQSLTCPFVAAKVAPAIDHALAASVAADLEFLSDSGECKEALLWMGAFRDDPAPRADGAATLKASPADSSTIVTSGSGCHCHSPGWQCGTNPAPEKLVRATVLTSSGAHTLSGVPADPPAPRETARYLYEPDPAVIRAHLVGNLARTLAAASIDPQIAYLLGDTLTATSFATAYEILDSFPFHQKALQRALTDRRIGSVIVKKRGFPKEPDEIRKGLRLSGPNQAVVILTRQGARHIAFLCKLVAGDSSPAREVV